MAAVVGRTKIGLRETGSKVTVPNDPRARLMYYLNTICSLLDLNDQHNLARLRNYSEYYRLTEEETDALVGLCFLLSPDELNGKVIFQNDEMCKDSNNNFFELSAVRSSLLISDSVLVGGQRRVVQNIMTYKMRWLDENWITPMRHFAPRLALLATGQRSETRSRAIAPPSEPALRQQQVPQQATYQPQPPTLNFINMDSDTDRDSKGCCVIL